MTTVADDPINITWRFFYFRRHIDKETKDCIQFIRTHHPMGVAFNEIVTSAGEGMCCSKCLPCGKMIFGDQALGGMVAVMAAAPIDGVIHAVMAPLCRDCAHKDFDILQTKCVEYMTSDLFAGAKVEILP